MECMESVPEILLKEDIGFWRSLFLVGCLKPLSQSVDQLLITRALYQELYFVGEEKLRDVPPSSRCTLVSSEVKRSM